MEADSTTFNVNRAPAQINQQIGVRACRQLQFFLEDASCFFQFIEVVRFRSGKASISFPQLGVVKAKQKTEWRRGSWVISARSVEGSKDHDRCPDSSELVDTFKIVVIEPDASMRHIFSQQTSIERPMDEIAFAESQCIFTEDTLLGTVGGILRHRESFFDECPIWLDPRGIGQFRLDEKFSSWRIENPLVVSFAGLVKNGSAAGRSNRIEDHFLLVLHIESVPGRIDQDVGLIRHELGQLLGEHLIPGLQCTKAGFVLDGGLVNHLGIFGRDAIGSRGTHDQQ